MGRDGKMGVHLDVPASGFAGRLEVIEGPTGRRKRTRAEKARITAESLMPGVRVRASMERRDGRFTTGASGCGDRSLWRCRSARLAPAFAAVVIEDAPRRPAAARIEIVVGDVVMRQHLAAADRLFMDETTAPVLDPGRRQTKKGFFWAIASDDRRQSAKMYTVRAMRQRAGSRLPHMRTVRE